MPIYYDLLGPLTSNWFKNNIGAASEPHNEEQIMNNIKKNISRTETLCLPPTLVMVVRICA